MTRSGYGWNTTESGFTTPSTAPWMHSVQTREDKAQAVKERIPMGTEDSREGFILAGCSGLEIEHTFWLNTVMGTRC